MRKDSLIGSFKLDVGLIYEQEMHTFSRKWVMLTDYKDPAAGVKGFLKISVSVLAPGDEVPLEETVELDMEEDIEGNLLRPVGVQPAPIDITVKIFNAVELPQTDPSFKTGINFVDRLTRQKDKELCDPYVTVNFAGRKVRTKVVEDSYNPVFMQELHLNAMFPSMCDKIQLKVGCEK